MPARRHRFTIALVAGAAVSGMLTTVAISGAAAASRGGLQFVTIDYPAGHGTSYPTNLNGVNDAGVLVGTYYTKGGVGHGFLVKGITLIPFDYPGAASTLPSGINAADVVAGEYLDSKGVAHGFIRFANGTFQALNDPVAGDGRNQGTGPENINDNGVVVGNYVDSKGVSHGFVYAHGSFTTIDAPGASASGGGTLIDDENDAGTIVGTFFDARGVSWGFIDDGGHFTVFAAPGAGSKAGEGTSPSAISNNGTIVGETQVQDGAYQAWLERAERFTPLNDPSASTTPPLAGTEPYNMSRNGEVVVGFYFGAHHTANGFYVYVGR